MSTSLAQMLGSLRFAFSKKVKKQNKQKKIDSIPTLYPGFSVRTSPPSWGLHSELSRGTVVVIRVGACESPQSLRKRVSK